MLVSVVLRRDRGFDITDEAFYLNNMRDPGLYEITVTQFGFVYHPWYELVGGDIGLLRLGNAMLIVLLAAVMVYRLQTEQTDRAWRVAVAAGAGSAALCVFGLGMLTPSYNSLNVTGLLLLVIGATLIVRVRTAASVAGVVIASFGISLSFAAKPTTAVLAGISALVLLAVDRRLAWWNILGALVATALMLGVFAVLIDGSPAAFAARLRAGATLVQGMEGGHGTADLIQNIWDEIISPDWLNWPLMLLFAGGLALVTLLWSLVLPRRVAFILGVAVAGAVLVVAFGGLDVQLPIIGRQYLVLGPVVGAFAAWLITRRHVDAVAWVVWLTLLPFLYSVGSNQILWFQAAMAGGFWIAAVVVLGGRQVLPVAGVSVLVSALVLAAMQSVPYRQPPLTGDLVAATFAGSEVRVDSLRARYLRDLQSAAAAGTPVVDLTGASPGALYAMDARAVGSGWLIGGYPGSGRVAQAYLEAVHCTELASAWLLVEPGGRRALPDDVVASFGAEVATDFEVVAEVTAPGGGKQFLMRPSRSSAAAERACEVVRSRRQAAFPGQSRG